MPTDTLQLHEVTVNVSLNSPARVSTTGNVTIRPDALLNGIHILGETDIIQHLKSLPGFSSTGDYSSGVSINGCDYSQTSFEVDGATVFFPYHFGGVFSTFNTPHFSSATAGALRQSTTSPSRLGGYISMTSDTSPADSLSGTANIGIISSAITLKVPIKSVGQTFVASIRRSYLNMIYGKLLNTDEISAAYDFTDANLAWDWRMSQYLSLKISALFNTDNLSYLARDSSLDTHLRWRNSALSGTLTYGSDNIDFRQTMAWSAFNNKLLMDLSQFSVEVPSSVSQFMANGSLSLASAHLDIGYRIEMSHFTPQYIIADGLIGVNSRRATSYESQMYALTAAYRFRPLPWLQLAPSVRGEIDRADSHNFYNVNPVLTSTAFWNDNTIALTLGSSTQNIHQVGFCDLGLSSNFWLPVSQRLKPQQSLDATVTYTGMSINNNLRWSATIYGKRIYNDAEYDGTILDLIANDYDAISRTFPTSGYNYGADMMLAYDANPVAAHITYGYHRSMRRHQGETAYHPSPYEIRNSLKLFLQWKLSPRIDISAAFFFATGRPYTPVKALYIMVGNIISVYADRNSVTLPAYQRLDLSMSYNFRPIRVGTKRIDNFLNITLLNAYGHRNVESQYYLFDSRNNTISLKRVASIYRFVPSLSYTIRF